MHSRYGNTSLICRDDPTLSWVELDQAHRKKIAQRRSQSSCCTVTLCNLNRTQLKFSSLYIIIMIIMSGEATHCSQLTTTESRRQLESTELNTRGLERVVTGYMRFVFSQLMSFCGKLCKKSSRCDRSAYDGKLPFGNGQVHFSSRVPHHHPIDGQGLPI